MPCDEFHFGPLELNVIGTYFRTPNGNQHRADREPSVGTISLGGARVPLKGITVEPGKRLDPPATNQAAVISRSHARLAAKHGTTVIAWHVRYGKGCPGTLNRMIHVPIGSTFVITTKSGMRFDYRIARRLTVPRGKLRPSWFDQGGPHRLALFSCADLEGSTFRKTVVMLAEPFVPTDLG